MNIIEKYYNKFNEDKRLLSRHGQVEFFVTTQLINKLVADRKNIKIADIGAGTGRYSAYYANQGHEVTAIELVNKNVSQIKTKNQNIIAKQGNALNLKRLRENYYDITLLFGPLYHLFSFEDKLKAIGEAKRITKPGGFILIMYLTNEYAMISYAFKEGKLQECLKNNKIDSNFQCITNEEDLYSYVRIEEINQLAQSSNLKRHKIIGVDGATDYIRPTINSLSDEDFEIYKQYQLSICERAELLGASSHILDVLQK